MVQRPGRTVQVFTSSDVLDISAVTQGIVSIGPGEVSKPCHAHLISDETLYVLKGTGQVYVDGEIAEIRPGSVILFPKKSKHMLRNNGSQELALLFTIFPASNPENEAYYESIEFPGS